jgi:hypothetical protein
MEIREAPPEAVQPIEYERPQVVDVVEIVAQLSPISA